MKTPGFTVGIVGAGRLGLTLGYLLKQHRYSISGVCNSSISSTTRAAAVLECAAFDDPSKLAHLSDVLFITTPDSSIRGVCSYIAERNGFRKSQIVLHTSGALPSSVLSPAREQGAEVGSMHPSQSFASFSPDASLRGVYFACEGDQKALQVIQKIVSDLGGLYVEIPPNHKCLYHASAVVASNYLVALAAFATKLYAATGVQENQAFAALIPLMEGTLQNLKSLGLPRALTGPISRGDSETIARHLEAINNLSPEDTAAYVSLGRIALELAEAQGFAEPNKLRAIKALLSEYSPFQTTQAIK